MSKLQIIAKRRRQMKGNVIKILTLVFSLCFAIGVFSACDKNQHVHEYSNTYSFDKEFHWYECECGEDKGKTQHVFENNKCVCGYEKSSANEGGNNQGGTTEHQCVFDRQVIHEDYLKSKADCVNKAVYYLSCKCGEKGSETFENGVELGHNYGEFVSNGDGTKTAVCANGCGIDKTVDEEHICDFIAGEKVEPTCEDGGYTVYNCSCGDSYKGDWVNRLGHDYGEYISNGDGTHTQTCSRDNSHIYTDDCYAGYNNRATCTKKAVCYYCNTEFGDFAPHTYSTTHSFDKTHHWFEAICGCVLEPIKEAHITGGNTCPTCEFPFVPTEGITYDLSADGTYAEVVGYTGSAKKVKIADTYQGKPVTSIYDNAFEDTYITYIEIPNSVTSIGGSAFRECNSLTSIEIPNRVTSIGNYAFSWCNSLTSIEIPNSVTSIGDDAFRGCSSLTSVVFEENSKLTSIGYGAFDSCRSLTSIEIPNSVTSIGECAFYDCYNLQFNEYENCKYLGSKDNPYFVLIEPTNKNLTTYTINNNTKIIAKYAFSNCSRLYSIEIPSSVTSIGEYAFYNCDSLTSVVIGDGVTSIGSSAFYDCDSLNKVNITIKDPNGWQWYYGTSWRDFDIIKDIWRISDYPLRKI